MKKDISTAFEELDERQLGILLEDMSAEATDAKSAENIYKNACRRAGLDCASTKRRPRIGRRAIVALAACAAVIASLAVGAFALAEDTKEYNDAVAFCEEHDISTDGMTRSEIKEVYRSFKNGAIVHDTDRPGEPAYTESTGEIGGTVFPAETGEPEAHAELNTDEVYYIDPKCYGWDVAQHALCCFDRNVEPIWMYVTDEIDLSWAEETDDGVVFTGHVPGTLTPIAIKLDKNGGHIWSRTLGKGNISSVMGEPDGSVTVFAYAEDSDNGTDNSVIVSRIDPAGELVFSTETKTTDPIRIGEAVHYGEGYLAIGFIDDFDGLWNVQRVMRVDAEGRVLGEFDYSADGVDYNLFDIALYGGKLYISAYARDNSVFGSLYGNEYWVNASVTDEEFTDMVKRAFKAVLLVCDPDSCDLNVFYEAEGSICRALSVDREGFLCWNADSFYYARYMPNITNFVVKGKAKIYTYRFDLDGRFADRTDTGEIEEF